ncbi:MAG: TadE/TadG family type IV pilus assembly protein [Boseongicola sp.]
MIKKLLKNESGNIAVLTTIMATPIMLLVAGVIDTNRHTRMQSVMQKSADAAVLAAFRSSKPGWRKRQKTAHRHFRVNIRNVKFAHGVRAKMTRTIEKRRLIFTYNASTKVDSIFGELSPFSGSQISVQSRAAWKVGTNEHARLIGNGDGKADQGKRW